ncbi:hypothetical protein [Streptomyces omiyaensis]|uniref:hypothetical protein n=1 Tax=Streptomyces omiyaensis TaxID=68247 RepID=UPI0036F5C658
MRFTGSTALADGLVAFGILLTAIGPVGGNLLALPRALGVEARLVRRATEPAEAAGRAAGDHERAVRAVRDAGQEGGLGAEPDPEPLRALRCCGRPGPERTGRRRPHGRRRSDARCSWRKRRPPRDCAPGSRPGPPPGPPSPSPSPSCAGRWPLADAERYGLRERFAQASVDLLRGPGSEQAALAAGAECEGDPEACRRLFERLTRTGPAAAAEPRRR